MGDVDRGRRKLGRPKEHGDRITTALRLPAELHDRLRSTAEERDTSMNHLLVRAARYYLDNCLVPLEPDASDV